MSKDTYNRTLEDLNEFKRDIINCNKHSIVNTLDFEFSIEKDINNNNLTNNEAKLLKNKLYKTSKLFSENCQCKKYKQIKER